MMPMFGKRIVKRLLELRNTEIDDDNNYISHHGIKGMHWGVRRYQNPDGSLTAEGQKRYSKKVSAMNTAESIYKTLDNFDYGCIIDGKRYNETKLDEVDWSKYRTAPLDKFEETQIGVCWDFTNYQHAKFKEAGIPHDTHMLVMDLGDDNVVTHTFTTFDDPNTGQKYWLEQALYSERGIHPVTSYKDAVKAITKRYGASNTVDFDVYSFNPDGMDQGLSDKEFFNRATANDPVFQRKDGEDVTHSDIFENTMFGMRQTEDAYLSHHGIKGQKWGVRNGPPYPLNSQQPISRESFEKVNDIFSRMPQADRKLIDPDVSDTDNYYGSYREYKQQTAYNGITDDGFIVAEKIPKDKNVDGTHGVEIGVGVISKGKGTGSKLTKDLVKWFDGQDEFDVIWWPVDEHNQASINLATKHGFIKDPLGTNYIYAKENALIKLGIDD